MIRVCVPAARLHACSAPIVELSLVLRNSYRGRATWPDRMPRQPAVYQAAGVDVNPQAADRRRLSFHGAKNMRPRRTIERAPERAAATRACCAGSRSASCALANSRARSSSLAECVPSTMREWFSKKFEPPEDSRRKLVPSLPCGSDEHSACGRRSLLRPILLRRATCTTDAAAPRSRALVRKFGTKGPEMVLGLGLR